MNRVDWQGASYTMTLFPVHYEKGVAVPTKSNKVKRSRTESELRLAAERVQHRLITDGMNDDDDHPALVFEDCIDELLALRELKAFVAGFNQNLTVKLARKLG